MTVRLFWVTVNSQSAISNENKCVTEISFCKKKVANNLASNKATLFKTWKKQNMENMTPDSQFTKLMLYQRAMDAAGQTNRNYSERAPESHNYVCLWLEVL